MNNKQLKQLTNTTRPTTYDNTVITHFNFLKFCLISILTR